MRIAICDDDPVDLQEIETHLRNYDIYNQFEINLFTDAAQFYIDQQNIPFDLVWMDIEMNDPNGYEISKKLVTYSPKPPLIIFVTHSMEYTIRGYGIAFRYLPKSMLNDQFHAIMDAAVQEIKANRFSFSIEGLNHVLVLSEIYYFEVHGHHTTVHTCDTEYTIRTPLKEIIIQLPQGYFAAPHKSFLVNLMHIKTATMSELSLTNGVHIPVSRRYQKNFDHLFYSYLGR